MPRRTDVKFLEILAGPAGATTAGRGRSAAPLLYLPPASYGQGCELTLSCARGAGDADAEGLFRLLVPDERKADEHMNWPAGGDERFEWQAKALMQAGKIAEDATRDMPFAFKSRGGARMDVPGLMEKLKSAAKKARYAQVLGDKGVKEELRGKIREAEAEASFSEDAEAKVERLKDMYKTYQQRSAQKASLRMQHPWCSALALPDANDEGAQQVAKMALNSFKKKKAVLFFI